MNAWVDVARRELHGRRILWAMAFALGLLVLGAPALLRAEVRSAVTAIVSLLFTGFVAFGVCGNMIGGELAERRASFYFTRPLSARALFGGKLAAALLLALGAQALIWLPTMVVDHALSATMLPFAGLLAALTPLLLALGFAAGIAARCRSRWLLGSAVLAVSMVALVAFVAVEGALVWELGWLSRAGGIALFGGTLGGLTVALLAGVAAAVAYGRTDPLRAHRALTIVAALALLPLGSAAFAASHRVLRPRLADVVEVRVAEGPPSGDWLYVSGSVAADRGGWAPDFLFDPKTGRNERIGWIMSDAEPAFSADGARVAWVELKHLYDAVGHDSSFFPEVTLVVRTFGGPTEVRADVAIGEVQGVAWSPDFRLIAIVGDKEAQLRRADTLHLVAEAKAPKGTTWRRAVFATPTTLRLFAGDEEGVEVVDLNADKRASVAVVHLDIKGASLELDVSPDGDRVFAQAPDSGARLWPAGGGAAITLATPSPNDGFCGGFLADGRIAVVHRSTAQVQLYSRQGRPERAIDLGAGRVSCAVDGSRFLVAVDPRPTPRDEHQQLWLIDATAGTARALDPRLRMLSTLRGVVKRPASGRLLASDVAGGLVAIDPASGATQTLIRGRAAN